MLLDKAFTTRRCNTSKHLQEIPARHSFSIPLPDTAARFCTAPFPGRQPFSRPATPAAPTLLRWNAPESPIQAQHATSVDQGRYRVPTPARRSRTPRGVPALSGQDGAAKGSSPACGEEIGKIVLVGHGTETRDAKGGPPSACKHQQHEHRRPARGQRRISFLIPS